MPFIFAFFFSLLQIILDVAQFEPAEITVKTTDKFIVVEGKHEEKQDEHGYVSRQFIRRYCIPGKFFICYEIF
jgi:crystallin, alpha B